MNTNPGKTVARKEAVIEETVEPTPPLPNGGRPSKMGGTGTFPIPNLRDMSFFATKQGIGALFGALALILLTVVIHSWIAASGHQADNSFELTRDAQKQMAESQKAMADSQKQMAEALMQLKIEAARQAVALEHLSYSMEMVSTRLAVSAGERPPAGTYPPPARPPKRIVMP